MPGYSSKSTSAKIGVKPGHRLLIKNTTRLPVPNYLDPTVPVQVSQGYEHGLDLVHVFVDSRANLSAELDLARAAIKPAGMIWISWPKRAALPHGEVSEDLIREIALPMGLVDTKVCSVTDELWSGLKLVWRLENRPAS